MTEDEQAWAVAYRIDQLVRSMRRAGVSDSVVGVELLAKAFALAFDIDIDQSRGLTLKMLRDVVQGLAESMRAPSEQRH